MKCSGLFLMLKHSRSKNCIFIKLLMNQGLSVEGRSLFMMTLFLPDRYLCKGLDHPLLAQICGG